MKLSIIVPVYNVKQYLDKCILSILNQNFKDFELLFIDDGSTDGSGDICDKWAYKDDRIKVVHKTNGGLSDARNIGIRKSSGEYIGFCDSDDWIELDMFNELISEALANDADISICRLQRVSSEGEVIEVIGYEGHNIFDRDTAMKEVLRDEPLPSYAVNKIYRRNLFEGIEYPLNRYFEDTATTYKLISRANKVVTTPYIGYNYLNNPNSLCNNSSIEYLKRIKREYDNALAFGERYIFCKNDSALSDVRVICANKAYMRMRSFLHLQAHKKFQLTDNQKKEVDTIMKSFSLEDLKDFSLFQKMDFIAYKYVKSIYSLYLQFLAVIHPMSRDL